MASVVIYRDLKPANMLSKVHDEEPFGISGATAYVGWFKCSSLVVGAGFWRSHEVLQALKEWNVRECLQFIHSSLTLIVLV